ncbi:MAG: ABC transporter ATP-binding protein [Lachnospiraceae bacterium]|nr:ABC transporter ATP-binding protein [Lachnospiraceae bacterium]
MGDDTLNTEPVLHIANLHKEYYNPTTLVLSDLSFDLYHEDFLCILGPSGCGKSTLIRCIAGFEKYQGVIQIKGKDVEGPGTDRIMVFQDFNQLFPWKTVLNNLTYPLKLNGMTDKNERREKAEEYLDKVNLLEYKDYYPHQLSGGMKQRVAIARAMALGSEIVLMDEPFAALDAMSRNQMQDELIRIKEKEKMTVLFITHNIQEAISCGNRIMVMGKNGSIIENMKNPIEKPVTPASAGYGELWKHLNQLLRDNK